MRSHGEISLDGESCEVFEWLRFHLPAHNSNHLLAKFEVWFETQIASGAAFEHEAEVWRESSFT